MFDFIQADETRHIAVGNHWVKWLLHDDPIPINVLSLRIAGFNDAEIAELVQKGGGNAALA